MRRLLAAGLSVCALVILVQQAQFQYETSVKRGGWTVSRGGQSIMDDETDKKARGGGRAPARSPSRTPVRNPVRVPARNPVRVPARNPVRVPTRTSFSRIRFTTGSTVRFSTPSFRASYRMSPTFRSRYSPVYYSNWHVFYVYYGYRYYRPIGGGGSTSPSQPPIYANVTSASNLSIIDASVVLSQKYTKSKLDPNDTVYTCGSGREFTSCYEPWSNYTDLIRANDSQLYNADDLIDGIDGACCEWTNGTELGVCCYVYALNKASALK